MELNKQGNHQAGMGLILQRGICRRCHKPFEYFGSRGRGRRKELHQECAKLNRIEKNREANRTRKERQRAWQV